MQRKLRKPSPAMVVACISLAIALSGASYAAVTLPRNSVGTTQLKNNAVNSAKVKNASLKAADFAAGQLPAGAQDRGLQARQDRRIRTPTRSTASTRSGSFRPAPPPAAT